jgi:hypothetical protein
MYYADSIQQQIQSAVNTANQFQTLIRMEERALQNLKTARDIRNPRDLMQWYDRQLSLERVAEEKFTNLGISVGGKNYLLSDVDGIGEALEDEYGDPFGREFTEQQSMALWQKHGLSPSNYVYVQTWAERDRQAATKIIGKLEALKQKNREDAERTGEIQARLATDGDSLGEMEVAQYSLEVGIDTNAVLRDLRYDMAERNAWDVARQKEMEKPANPPRLSYSYNNEYFDKIGEDLD